MTTDNAGDARWPHVLTLEEQCIRAGGITPEEIEHFHALVAVWQLLADLSFADLLLLAPILGDPDENLLVLAQIRPDTVPTVYQDDHVGTALLRELHAEASLALRTGKQQSSGPDSLGIARAAIPVRAATGRFPGVILRVGQPFGGRAVSALEQAYVQCAEAVSEMIVNGEFPFAGMGDWETPRPSDGLMVLAPGGTVVYASPNAVAAHRRLGIHMRLPGGHVRDLPGGQALLAAMSSTSPLQGEVEIGGSVVARRLVPFRVSGQNAGGLVLVQDVTEVRRRDRMVLYKDAVIREIHHRVKNNLQTTASLLRLQSRRITSEEGKAALEESVRRISAIALVHENLSQATTDLVDFSEVLRGILRMLDDALGLAEQGVRMRLEGQEIDELPAVVATPLALVVNELVQNAAEHAFVGREGGTITVSLAVEGDTIHAVVTDDGIGYPSGVANPRGLGMQIVSALVEHELKGSITRKVGEGTRFDVVIPLPSGPR